MRVFNRKLIACLLMLALLVAGVHSVFGETGHAAHGHELQRQPGGPGEPHDEHGDHCGHSAGHLLGAVGSLQNALISSPDVTADITRPLMLNPGQAPPTPPPTNQACS